jgi:hypothetical protein
MKTVIPSPNVLPDLTFNLKYTFLVAREPVRSGTRVQLTIRAEGRIIAERTTRFRHLYALVCALNQADVISLVQDQVDFWNRVTEREEALHRGDPAALKDYGCIHSHMSPVAMQERFNQERFGARAKRHRVRLIKYQARLARLLAGPVEECGRLCLYSWHQRRSLVYSPGPGVKMIGVLSIPTGLP